MSETKTRIKSKEVMKCIIREFKLFVRRLIKFAFLSFLLYIVEIIVEAIGLLDWFQSDFRIVTLDLVLYCHSGIIILLFVLSLDRKIRPLHDWFKKNYHYLLVLVGKR